MAVKVDQAEHPLRAVRRESRSFFNEVIGLHGRDGLDWILFFGADQEELQLSVMKLDIKARLTPTCQSRSMTSTMCVSVPWPRGRNRLSDY